MHTPHIGFKIAAQRVNIALAHLAQHPSHSLVYKIVRVAEKFVRYAQRVGKTAGFHKGHRSHYRYALLPQVVAPGQSVEHTPLRHAAVGTRQRKPRPQHLVARKVHEVPVVGAPRMCEIKTGDFTAPRRPRHKLFATPRSGILHFLHEQQKAREPGLVPRTA